MKTNHSLVFETAISLTFLDAFSASFSYQVIMNGTQMHSTGQSRPLNEFVVIKAIFREGFDVLVLSGEFQT